MELSSQKGIRFWFVIFSIQILAAAIVPSAVMLMLPAQGSPMSIEVSGITLENVNPEDFRDILTEHFQSIVRDGAIVFESEGKQFRLPYSSIGLQIDGDRICDALEKGNYSNRFFQLIGKESYQATGLKPEIYINEVKYRDVVSDIRDFYHREQRNAELVLKQDTLSVEPHHDGLEFHADPALQYIQERLQDDLSKELVISQDTASKLFSKIKPEVTTDYLQKFQIYGLAEGKLPDGKSEAFGRLVETLENKRIKPGETFSFRERILSFSETDSLQSLLASAIYQAVLPVVEIKITGRIAANQPMPGIAPGLEINLENGGDLQFVNTSKTDLILVFDISEPGVWKAALAGQPGLSVGTIKTETMKISPSVIYSQDSTLAENVQEVREPGKEGLSVKVYRVVEGVSTELYEDTYQPVHKIIAVGTGIKKEDIIRK